MEYVNQSLTPGEQIVYEGQFHWMYTLHAILNIVWGVVGCLIALTIAIELRGRMGEGFPPGTSWIGAARDLHPGIRLGAFLVLILGVLKFAHMMVIRASTEIAVTSKRIIYKRGLVARAVGEIDIDRIEGVSILQSIPGRIFGYGRVLVRGMGIGEVILPPIANPVSFRKSIENARDVKQVAVNHA